MGTAPKGPGIPANGSGGGSGASTIVMGVDSDRESIIPKAATANRHEQADRRLICLCRFVMLIGPLLIGPKKKNQVCPSAVFASLRDVFRR